MKGGRKIKEGRRRKEDEERKEVKMLVIKEGRKGGRKEDEEIKMKEA